MEQRKTATQPAVGRIIASPALALSELLASSACAASATEGPAAQQLPASKEAPTPVLVWPEGQQPGTIANPYSIGEEMADGDVACDRQREHGRKR
jgi:hypothetical protein